MPVVSDNRAQREAASDGELDFRAVGRAVWRRKMWVIVPAALAGLAALAAVNLMTPRYKSESRIIVEGRESTFTRPEAEKNSDRERSSVDQEAVNSQVQLALSREVARQVIGDLKLTERPEFDPVLRGIGPLRHVLILLGISRDPLAMTPEERVFEAYYERVQAFQVDKSRVISVEFQSADPELAARGANAVAEAYLIALQSAKRDQGKAAGDWLSGEIEKLRVKVAEAEAKVEEFRSRSNLYVGTNNGSLANQQLGELASQLATARSQKAEADARAQSIRDMLRSGRPIESGDVINSELIRRLNEQRVTLRAQLAEQLSTLLDSHPRIKELRAQIGDLERQIRTEAERLVRSLEADARIAAARVEQLSAGIEQLKRQASTSSGQDVQLRALEREAKSQRDLLESYLAKYREVGARDSMGALPTDARLISRAIVSNTPFFPKKAPIVLIAFLGTMLMAIGFITTGELLSSNGGPVRQSVAAEPAFASPGIEFQDRVIARQASAAMEQAVEAAPSVVPADAPVEPLKSSFVAAGHTISSIVERFRDSASGRTRAAVVSLDDASDAREAAAVLARGLAVSSRSVWLDASLARQRSDAGRGIADLVRGKASFGEIITRDGRSRAHFIGAGQGDSDDVSLLATDRLSVAIEALERTYDHVTIDAGSLHDVPAQYVAQLAPSVVLVVRENAGVASDTAVEALRAAGCREVLVIVGPIESPTAKKETAAAA